MPLPPPRMETSAPNSLWRAGAHVVLQRPARQQDRRHPDREHRDRGFGAAEQHDRAQPHDRRRKPASRRCWALSRTCRRPCPGTPSLDPAIGFDSTSTSNGTGSVNRQETVSLTVAAVITDRLPNGNLVIGGSQEVRINNELRELLVSGVIRPEDVGVRQHDRAHQDRRGAHLLWRARRHQPGAARQVWQAALRPDRAVLGTSGFIRRRAVELAATRELLKAHPRAQPADGRDAQHQQEDHDLAQRRGEEVEPVQAPYATSGNPVAPGSAANFTSPETGSR